MNMTLASVKKGNDRSVAYITDVFPGITLTFVYLEIKKLREAGLCIDIYSIWKSNQTIASREAESFRAETTYLSPPRLLPLLRAHLHFARTKPTQYLETLKLCLAPHPNLRFRRRTIYNFCLAPYLAAHLAKKKTRHIHAHFASGAATTAMMASTLLGISFSFTAHRGDILDEKVLLQEKVKRAKFGIAISEYNRACLLLVAPDLEENRIVTIHCGVETDVFLPSQRKQTGPLVFLSVGSLLPRKGHVYLLAACRLLKEHGINFQCIIIGEGPQRNELQGLIQKYGIEEKVKLVGSIPHEDVQIYYDKTDIFVLPSLNEGIPVVLMEAMSKGLPVVATRITGIPELVTHEKHGILVSPGDHTDLADAMMRLAKDTAFRKILGGNARNKIETEFNLEKNVSKINSLFQEAMS
jgi:colanic acid/amylovoran biosynthesis glycosyltransferase